MKKRLIPILLLLSLLLTALPVLAKSHSHNFVYFYKNQSVHNKVCYAKGCTYKTEEKHDIKCTKTKDTHEMVCKKCKTTLLKKSKHDFRWAFRDRYKHKIICSVCYKDLTENHSATAATKGKKTEKCRCGYKRTKGRNNQYGFWTK